MNIEYKNKWLEALRSGRYKQGQDHLKRGDDFCCLGVLCDVSGLGEWKKLGPWEEYVIEGDGLHSVKFISQSLARTLEIDSHSQEFLAKMNDGGDDSFGRPVPFTAIADWIEKNL